MDVMPCPSRELYFIPMVFKYGKEPCVYLNPYIFKIIQVNGIIHAKFIRVCARRVILG
jgi:hypothetical protein